jgi:hypothetical protein
MANIVVTTGDLLEAKVDTKYPAFIDALAQRAARHEAHAQLNAQFKDRP